MKIRELPNNGARGLLAIDNERRPQTDSLKSKGFRDQLVKAEENHWRERLDKLLKDIDKQGKRLGKEMTVKELKVYKEMIKTFLNEVVGKTYSLKEEASFDRRGRHKLYTLIEKVDVKLEELTKAVVNQQEEGLNILEKLDEIKGLLIDIYS